MHFGSPIYRDSKTDYSREFIVPFAIFNNSLIKREPQSLVQRMQNCKTAAGKAAPSIKRIKEQYHIVQPIVLIKTALIAIPQN